LGNAHQVPGLDQLNTGKDASIPQLSCPPGASPGNCTAAGIYNDGTINAAFIANELNGTWGPAIPLHMPVPAGDTLTDVKITSLSCGAPGSCIVGGVYAYTPNRIVTGFYAEERNGVLWLSASTSGGEVASIVSSVSCSSAQNCTVGGMTFGPGPDQAFLWDEVNGSWGGLPQPVQGLSGLHAAAGNIAAVSCEPLQPGNCTATGEYGETVNPNHPFVVDEQAGSWGNAQPLPDNPLLKATNPGVVSVSCPAAGNCAIGGVYTGDKSQEQVFVAAEAAGTAGAPQQIPGMQVLNTGRDGAWLFSVSCATAGNCVAAGYYSDSGNFHHAFVAEERNGDWGQVHPLAGSGPLANGTASEAESVSCPAPGYCVVGGWFMTAGGDQQAFTASEVNGGWGKASVVPGSSALNTGKDATAWAVSCAAAGNCVIGGDYSGSGITTAFVADKATATATSLKLSAARVRIGHEQAEKISATVTPRTGGTPGGKITVTAGKATICVITMSHGTGSCVLAATGLRPGTYHLIAHYSGSKTYAGSASAAKTLTVTR
jgi:hypothetical protein